MSFECESDQGLKELIEAMGSFWEWDKKTLKGVQSDNNDTNTVELEGLLPDSSFVIAFRLLDFTDGLPDAGQTIRDIAKNITYRIVGVMTSQTDPSVNITCASIDGK